MPKRTQKKYTKKNKKTPNKKRPIKHKKTPKQHKRRKTYKQRGGEQVKPIKEPLGIRGKHTYNPAEEEVIQPQQVPEQPSDDLVDFSDILDPFTVNHYIPTPGNSSGGP